MAGLTMGEWRRARRELGRAMFLAGAWAILYPNHEPREEWACGWWLVRQPREKVIGVCNAANVSTQYRGPRAVETVAGAARAARMAARRASAREKETVAAAVRAGLRVVRRQREVSRMAAARAATRINDQEGGRYLDTPRNAVFTT